MECEVAGPPFIVDLKCTPGQLCGCIFSREKSDGFKKLLTKLEEEANQTLQSLVTAPMQRITKLPLLMKEILKRTPLDDPNRVQMEATHRATQEVKIRYFRLNEVKVIYIKF